MATHYLVSIKQQLQDFVANTASIQYPCTLQSNSVNCTNKQALLGLIQSTDPNQTALIAFQLLPIYHILPNVLIHLIMSLLTPYDRIQLSHTCSYFRSIIISPRGLSDLWLYIYHIPVCHNMRVPRDMTTNPSPSHATSLPNTLATSLVMSSRPPSAKSLFKSSNSTSSGSPSPATSPRNKFQHIEEETKHDIHDDAVQRSMSFNYTPMISVGFAESDSITLPNATQLALEKVAEDESESESTMHSNDPLLQHPSNPTLTSKIIYWPNYKQVLACDFPIHWRRKNAFYQNLCTMSKNCGGAHIRVFEIGHDRLKQILSRISPMLLSLCFQNARTIYTDASYFKYMHRLQYLAYQYIDVQCSLHIPPQIIALEFTSCSFNAHCFVPNTGILPNIKFLQINNCRFKNYSFQRLLSMCPNVVHLSITTSSWDDTINLPSNLLSITWRHNEGEFSVARCEKVWEVAVTIYDTEIIEQLQTVTSLRQLVIATPMFKGMDFLDEIETPWSFMSQQSTPYFDAKSPSVRSISHLSLSPNLPALSHRLSSGLRLNSPTMSALNLNHHNSNNTKSPLASSWSSLQQLGREQSSGNFSSSLDSDDEEDDGVYSDKLRIVCFQDLIQKEWFTQHFCGDHIEFHGQRILNPILQSELNKLNSIFVQEMQQTTHMFLLSFPFF
eukprot:CAMPEP_0197026464 /NCGR_PEP_ID=MMETSP1384-20130603/6542_1 /TAXON_ID=29189 /ORGANISM="Ammonia sp." /LENGTH=669 /DNA_ID=CAMNT_0042455129 /DNA_START=27 /DNA_END=2036 /DNA_ORIENTATION=+